MHRLFTLGFWLTIILSAHGFSVIIPVTTTNLDQYKYRFSLSTNAAMGGVSFHVIVAAKKEDIQANSEVGLSMVTNTITSSSAVDVKPKIPIRVKKDTRAWEADFTVPFELLERPGLCFIFTEFGPGEMPSSADYYEVKLCDFLKR